MRRRFIAGRLPLSGQQPEAAVHVSGTHSSVSNDSVHNQAEVASQHASTVGTAGSKSSRSMAVLNTAVRHATDGFIGILDMFGFEDPKVFFFSFFHLVRLSTCTNLFLSFHSRASWNICASTCAPRRCSISSTRTSSSGASSLVVIQCELEPDYVDNVPCIHLISWLVPLDKPLYRSFPPVFFLFQVHLVLSNSGRPC